MTEIADEVRSLYRAAKMNGGATVVETVSPPDTDDGDAAGDYFSARVEITYRHDIAA